MRLDPKEKLYGQHVLKIREVVRHAMQEKFFERTNALIITEISKILLQSIAVSKQVMEQLIKDEYLTLNKATSANVLHYELVATEKGRRFGIATANPAITRLKANELLSDLIERAKAINEKEDLVYIVERIKVFGSYLSGKELLGDLDVAVKLTRRYHGADFTNKNEERIMIASQNGRRFANFIDQISWPHTEVMLLLKTKKKGLSLHNEDEDEILTITENKLVYEFIKPTDG
jgi:hypothetical protein